MDDIVDLDAAAAQIGRRVETWQRAGIVVGAVTWRDQGEGWPPVLRTDREAVRDADSIGIALSKDIQEGEVVLFKGGWCDFTYWSGRAGDEPVQDAPVLPDQMTVEAFGTVLDRLGGHFA